MNIGRAQKRITLWVILPAALVYFGLRFYAQFRHVDVFVSRIAPMPPEIAAAFEKPKIDRTITIESPYESVADKILTPAEIRRLRSTIAWTGAMPPFFDSLTIQSSNRASARRITSRVILEYQFARHGDRWLMEGATRSPNRWH
jgi:hypothetical protein